MKCLICIRQARGFGHADTRFPIGDVHRYPIDWIFCSLRCQQVFHARYDPWANAAKDNTEAWMIDTTDIEHAAMRACLKAFDEAAALIGFDRPLGGYSEADALAMIDAIVTCYANAMAAYHDASAYPPVRAPLPKNARSVHERNAGEMK
jgi:hypothetical protein